MLRYFKNCKVCCTVKQTTFETIDAIEKYQQFVQIDDNLRNGFNDDS